MDQETDSATVAAPQTPVSEALAAEAVSEMETEEEVPTKTPDPATLQATEPQQAQANEETKDPTSLQATEPPHPQPDEEPATTKPPSSSSSGDNKHLRDTSQLTTAQKDELCCMLLRFSFQEAPFHDFYMDLRHAKWVYKETKRMYLPPDVVDSRATDPSHYLTAKELTAHLDYFSLAGTTTNDLTGDKKGEVPRLALGQEERWRNLRDEVLTLHYLRMLKKDNKSNETTKNLNSAKMEEAPRTTRSKTSTDTDTTATKRKLPARQARNNQASVTEADRGAGLYLNKTQIQAKEKARRKSLNANKLQQSIPQQQEDLAPFERLSLEECIAKGKEYQNIPEVEALEAPYKAQFKDWRFFLATNHSLLLYGFGSKRHLLNEFAEKELSKEGYALVLDGFDPECTVAAILDLLVQVFLESKEPEPLEPCLPGSEDEETTEVEVVQKDTKRGQFLRFTTRKIRDPLHRAKAIAKAIAATQTKATFLVVHNIEGFRTRQAQEILSLLVHHAKTPDNLPVLRLIASMDHVDTPLLWTEKTSWQYKWMWKEVHTHRPYADELIMLAPDEINTASSSKKRRASGGRGQGKGVVEGKGGDRLIVVLNSLAARYTEVMQHLARLQLQAQAANANTKWVDFGQLLSKCLEKCTVKNENQLQTYMVELQEQDLMAVQKQGSTATNVRIPYSDEKLHEILALERK